MGRREWATTNGDPGDDPVPPDGAGWDLRGVYTYQEVRYGDRYETTTVEWCWQRDVEEVSRG